MGGPPPWGPPNNMVWGARNRHWRAGPQTQNATSALGFGGHNLFSALQIARSGLQVSKKRRSCPTVGPEKDLARTESSGSCGTRGATKTLISFSKHLKSQIFQILRSPNTARPAGGRPYCLRFASSAKAIPGPVAPGRGLGGWGWVVAPLGRDLWTSGAFGGGCVDLRGVTC